MNYVKYIDKHTLVWSNKEVLLINQIFSNTIFKNYINFIFIIITSASVFQMSSKVFKSLFAYNNTLIVQVSFTVCAIFFSLIFINLIINPIKKGLICKDPFNQYLLTLAICFSIQVLFNLCLTPILKYSFITLNHYYKVITPGYYLFYVPLNSIEIVKYSLLLISGIWPLTGFWSSIVSKSSKGLTKAEKTYYNGLFIWMISFTMICYTLFLLFLWLLFCNYLLQSWLGIDYINYLLKCLIYIDIFMFFSFYLISFTTTFILKIITHYQLSIRGYSMDDWINIHYKKKITVLNMIKDVCKTTFDLRSLFYLCMYYNAILSSLFWCNTAYFFTQSLSLFYLKKILNNYIKLSVERALTYTPQSYILFLGFIPMVANGQLNFTLYIYILIIISCILSIIGSFVSTFGESFFYTRNFFLAFMIFTFILFMLKSSFIVIFMTWNLMIMFKLLKKDSTLVHIIKLLEIFIIFNTSACIQGIKYSFLDFIWENTWSKASKKIKNEQFSIISMYSQVLGKAGSNTMLTSSLILESMIYDTTSESISKTLIIFAPLMGLSYVVLIYNIVLNLILSSYVYRKKIKIQDFKSKNIIHIFKDEVSYVSNNCYFNYKKEV